MNGRAWTAADDTLIAERASQGVDYLANALERTRNAVSGRASKIGVRLGRNARGNLVESLEGFMQRVEFDPFGGCWLWSAYQQSGGYGATTGTDHREILAHRLSWALHNGSVPKGQVVCHKCDVRCCVNPAHLFLGSAGDNTDDMVRKGRHAFGERQGAAQIDDLTAARIHDLLRQGIGPTEAARIAGCSKAIARNIAYAGSWKHAANRPSTGPES